MTESSAKAVLEEMLASIHERREKLARHVHHREEPLPQDFAEQAIEVENDETMLALERELTEKEKQAMQALTRIEEGTYGVCTNCGEEISAGRLQALPAAGLCFDCADLEG
ncbi:MAG: TraR/DksA family transcriptional regulator [Pseudomonadaceae bacterium]|nr:TraR/DksA family transcriptional regulator [Pseudomonadaceae bacterium]